MDHREDDRTATAASARAHARPWVLAAWEGGWVQAELPEEGFLRIGRADDNDLIVRHRSISRHHARLHVVPIRIEDLGGVNGTTLGGRRLAQGTATLLRSGEAIYLGDVMLLVQVGEGGGQPAEEMVAIDDDMLRVLKLADTLATTEQPVVLIGETGTGKTTLTERIHARSRRSGAPLFRFNCAALDEASERELVGERDMPGVLERARGSTLLLEGIDELAMPLQVRILRAVASCEVVRIGEAAARSVDIRVLATSSTDLAMRVDAGVFRRDLYYRLHAATLTIPPLRKRPRDILPLARALAARATAKSGRTAVSIDSAARRVLERHSWPGNVRELYNVVETTAFTSQGDVLDAAQLAARISAPAEDSRRPGARALASALADAERARIVEALEQSGGNQTRAAELLGISRRTLVARLTEYDLPRPLKSRR